MGNKKTDVNTLGEFGLIDHLTEQFAIQNASTLLGVGDDAALIDIGNEKVLAISTDSLVEGIHFDVMYSPLKHLGYKAVVVNLSDIAAMNIVPTQITVSLAFSSKYTVEAMEELYKGIKLACEVYGVDLVGGDTTSAPKGLFINIAAIGIGDRDKVCKRNTAKEGDILCVTGDLGAAYLGLQLLEREKQVYLEDPNMQPELDEHAYLVERQLKPEARVDMVKIFAKANFIPTAMIDVSDGIASDILHICKQSKVGVLIEEVKVPIKQEVEILAIDFNMDPITVALSGGEDYELLFTADEKDLETIQHLPNTSIIGEIMGAEQGASLLTSGGNIHPLKAQGWKHF